MDDPTGLYYYGARYYAAWLGRWISCDPGGIVDGPNLYMFVRNNPLHYIDPQGYKVLALGMFITPEGMRGFEGVREVAQQSLPGQEVIDIKSMPSFSWAWDKVFDVDPKSKFRGLGSAVVVQEGLEGGGGVTAIHFDARSVDVLRPGHTGSELRSIIVALRKGWNSKVDIHILSEKGLSTIKKGTSAVVGAPLPEEISQFLPRSFRGLPTVTQGAVSLAKGVGSSLLRSIPGYEIAELAGGGSAIAGAKFQARYSIAAAASLAVTGGVAAKGLLASSITEIAAAGGGAIAASAGLVALSGAIGYGIGTGLNRLWVEPLIDKLAPGSGAVGDWYYRTFLK